MNTYENHLKIIKKLVRLYAKYCNINDEEKDLIQVGFEAFEEAKKTFDSNKKTKFTTWAYNCARTKLMRYTLSENKSAGYVNKRSSISPEEEKSVLRIHNQLMEDKKCKPTISQIAERAEMPPRKVELIINKLVFNTSYFTPVTRIDDFDSHQNHDFKSGENIENIVLHKDTIYKAINTLSNDEKKMHQIFLLGG